MCCSSNASEDVTFHELIHIRSKAVNDVMVIPDVDLRDLTVRRREWLCRIPGPDISMILTSRITEELSAAIKWNMTDEEFTHHRR